MPELFTAAKAATIMLDTLMKTLNVLICLPVLLTRKSMSLETA